MWFSVNRVCPTKIAFFVACVGDDQGVLRLRTHRLRSLLQAPCLCRQGAWRWYNSPICGSMALLHGCRWFCRLCVLLQQCWDEARFCVWRVGIQCCFSAITCGPPMNLQWLQLTRTNLVPGLETQTMHFFRACWVQVACRPKHTCCSQCFTTMGHDLRSSIALVPGHGVVKKCSFSLNLLPHNFS